MTWAGLQAALASDPGGVRKVLDVSVDLGIDTKELAHVIEIESGWRPDALNPSTRATGLLQFMPSTAAAMGTTVDALARMTRAEQATYVRRYLAPYARRIRRAGDVYVAVAGPAGLGQPDAAILYDVGSPGWTANPGWRTPGDGPVTVGRIRAIGRAPAGVLPSRATGAGAPPMLAGAGWILPLAILLYLSGPRRW
jgi:soluble lytic murein transglycosylase-like protein